MRVLFLHPEDSPLSGPWSGQRWDLIVDMGKCSTSTALMWQKSMGCPVLRSASFSRGIDDCFLIREMLGAGRGSLLDDEGIDWWDLTCLELIRDSLAVLIMQRMKPEVSSAAELWATRPGWPGNALSAVLNRPVQAFSGGAGARSVGRLRHYARLSRRFSVKQAKQIFLDKYDSGYRWRSRFAASPPPVKEVVILLPSAYSNVSRMAAQYARLLPEHNFLMVTTRRDAYPVGLSSNMRVRNLASYAKGDSPERETSVLLSAWQRVLDRLCEIQAFEILVRVGAFRLFPHWFREGLRARDAWRETLDREPVSGVLCGDDSNLFTRLPVLLASRRGIPTVDFHHGALDGYYLFKDLPCHTYLAKGEMERDFLVRVCGLPGERIVIGAPPGAQITVRRDASQKTAAILFSEPYEVAGLRTAEVYREILPPLLGVVRGHGRKLILKLHPFESLSQRRSIVKHVLSPEDLQHIVIVDGPLTAELLSRAWFGITLESTAALDCTLNYVPCFLCEWLAISSFEYVQQFARFGLGHLLRDASEIAGIPDLLSSLRKDEPQPQTLWRTAQPEAMRQGLASGPVASGARQAS